MALAACAIPTLPVLLAALSLLQGYTLRGLKFLNVSKQLAETHYSDLSSKPFFPSERQQGSAATSESSRGRVRRTPILSAALACWHGLARFSTSL